MSQNRKTHKLLSTECQVEYNFPLFSFWEKLALNCLWHWIMALNFWSFCLYLLGTGINCMCGYPELTWCSGSKPGLCTNKASILTGLRVQTRTCLTYTINCEMLPEHQTFLEIWKSVNQKEIFITLVMRLTRNANC